MAIAEANGIELTYEVDGTGPPLLLIMGLGGQLTDWHPGFLDLLAQSFTVIRFDNRDSGLSTPSQSAVPSRWELVKGNLWPRSIKNDYTLDDLADDASALLDTLGIKSAHVVGMSMGGMIAQLLTLRHPDKVRSLCSIMSHVGDRRSGRPTARVVAALAGRGRPAQPDDALRLTLDLMKLAGGADWDRSEHQRRTTASIARAYNPGGVLRQSQAIAAAPSRARRLAAVTQPTVIIHGLDDTLIRPSGGVATAKAIQHSRLLMLPRMGHDLPATRHQVMADAIQQNTERTNSQS